MNAIAPGVISTPATATLFDPETIACLVPIQRAGTPQEIAGLVAYLVSDSNLYLSGQII